MAAATFDITIDQGATYSLLVTFQDATGQAIDLTTATVSGMLKTSYTAASASATFTVTSTTPTSGQCLLSLPSATTATLSPGTYVYDIYLTTAGGSVTTRELQGQAIVTAQVTR